ncbi:MAG: hypothetical protein ACYC1X_02455 [Coriobacteriia bacterium]
MRYILLDTNIYVYCALASIERHKSELLHSLCDLLDREGNALIVPEIVELEFPRVLERERDRYESTVSGALTDLEQLALSDRDKQTLKSARDKITKLRRESIQDGKETFTDLVKHKSTIRLPMTPDVMVAAARLSVSGTKPSKGRNGHLDAGYVLEPDCVIVASVQLALADGTLPAPTEIALVTNNIKDFADQTQKPAVTHPDIAALIPCNVSYHRGLPSLLNALNETPKMPAEQVSRYDQIAMRLSAGEGIPDAANMFRDLSLPQLASLQELARHSAATRALVDIALPREAMAALEKATAFARPSADAVAALGREMARAFRYDPTLLSLIGAADRLEKIQYDAELDAAYGDAWAEADDEE